MEENLSRRTFINLFAALGTAGVIAGCGGGEKTEGQSAGSPSPATCNDTSGLDEQTIRTRETLQYVNESPDPAKTCDVCNFYTVPEGGTQCGGCQLFQGPVAPGGYCVSWAAKITPGVDSTVAAVPAA